MNKTVAEKIHYQNHLQSSLVAQQPVDNCAPLFLPPQQRQMEDPTTNKIDINIILYRTSPKFITCR